MRLTTEAEDAWCPPILIPSGFGRSAFAWCTIHALSQRTRRWIEPRKARSASVRLIGAVATISPYPRIPKHVLKVTPPLLNTSWPRVHGRSSVLAHRASCRRRGLHHRSTYLLTGPRPLCQHLGPLRGRRS